MDLSHSDLVGRFDLHLDCDGEVLEDTNEGGHLHRHDGDT